MMLDLIVARARHIVESAGARFDGTMSIPGSKRLVLFTSPRTGSTLAISLSDLFKGGQAAVKCHLAESDAKFGLLP